MFEGDLIAAGWFSTAGGVPATNVARWDGASWSALGDGVPSRVTALAVYEGQLFANEYRWTGTDWEDFAQADSRVSKLTVWNGKLILAGFFSTVQGVAAEKICAWDGSTIQPLGVGCPDDVIALQVYGDDLAAAVYVGYGDEPSYDLVQLWDGTSWASLNFEVPEWGECFETALGVFQGRLLVSTNLNYGLAGEILIRQYDGTQWLPFITVTPYRQIYVFHETGGGLLIGGHFNEVESVAATNVAVYNGVAAQPLVGDGLGLDGDGATFCADGGELIVGGEFRFAGTQFSPAAVTWTGSAWAPRSDLYFQGSPFEPYLNAKFESLVSDGAILYGSYSFYGGCVEERFLCSWDGAQQHWVDLEYGNRDLAAVAGQVYAVKDSYPDQVEVYQNSAWQPVPGEFDGSIATLHTWNGRLIAGGGFDHVDDLGAKHVAAWNLTEWEPLDRGLPGPVGAFGAYDGQLVATYEDGGAQRVACWDGTAWTDLPGAFNNDIHALQQYGTHLYAGGGFSAVDGLPAGYLAWWSGKAWAPYGTGCDAPIEGLAVHNNQLWVTGRFTEAGGSASRGIACLSAPLDPTTPVDPQDDLVTAPVFRSNHPNPFNPMTTFTFDLPGSSYVELNVYDMRGRLIAEVAGEDFAAGVHQVTWNGRDQRGVEAPSGVYFAKLVSNSGQETRKITLAR